MAAPIVTYYNEAGTEQVTTWNIGEVDAQDFSEELKITLWNNKGGTSEVSTMKKVQMHVLTAEGSDTGSPLVENNWTEVKVNDETEFTEIGGSKFHDIAAKGVTDPETNGYNISGAVNTGTVDTDVNNYANITLRLHPPVDAKEGVHDFIVRTKYRFT